MENEEILNAVAIRPRHVGRFAEYDTVVTEEAEAAGLGTLGDPVTIRGMIVQVANGNTGGRAWTRLTVRPTAPTITQPLISVLGSHRTVRLLAED
jgi:hypothetical protein